MNNIKIKNVFNLKEKEKLIDQNLSLKQIKFFKYKNVNYTVIIIVFLILFLRIRNLDEKFNKINIAMSLNDNYTYPIMVSITSIILNSNKNTFIEFHIIYKGRL